MTFNLGFIGGGNMSTAIAKGILQNGKKSDSESSLIFILNFSF